MKKLVWALALAFGLAGYTAYADESCGTADTTTGGISVLTAANNKQNGLLCQNLGTVAAVCSIGGTPTTSHGFSLSASGGNLSMQVTNVTKTTGSGQVRLPGGAIKCITGSSSAVVCCDSW